MDRRFDQIHDPVTARRAFTLVELLVVIGIIAVLIAILLPTLGMARQQAKQTAELAATRQLMLAYLSYTQDNRGWLIPGHISENLKLTDDTGKILSPSEAGKRWPWRLAAHIKYGLKGTLFVNEQIDIITDRSSSFWTYYASLLPSYGLNYFNLGGDLTGDGIANAPGWIKRITQCVRTSQMIVFASTRSPQGFPRTEGYFKIIPPTKSSEYSATGWSAGDYQESGDPAAWGYIHLRYNGRAVVACLDGHSEMLTLNELRDMRRWSNPAVLAGNPNWPRP